MKKLFFILCCTILIGQILYAQDSVKTGRKFPYNFSINIGMLSGKDGNSITPSANTIHGVSFGKRLRVGAGVGFDVYDYWQTSPVFGSVSYDLIQSRNTAMYLQCNYGWAHAWRTKPYETTYYGTVDRGGAMSMAMIGARMKASDKINIYFAVGYKRQSVESSAEPGIYYPLDSFAPMPSGLSQKIEQSFQRFVVTLGVGWR